MKSDYLKVLVPVHDDFLMFQNHHRHQIASFHAGNFIKTCLLNFILNFVLLHLDITITGKQTSQHSQNQMKIQHSQRSNENVVNQLVIV